MIWGYPHDLGNLQVNVLRKKNIPGISLAISDFCFYSRFSKKIPRSSLCAHDSLVVPPLFRLSFHLSWLNNPLVYSMYKSGGIDPGEIWLDTYPIGI